MIKKYLLAATFILSIASPVLAQSDGTLTTLNPWVSTTSPVTAITQRVFGRPLYLTGLNPGECLQVAANGLATTSGAACGSGGGGSGGGTWSTTTSSVAGQLVNYPNNTSDVVAIGSNSTTTAEFWFDPNTLRSLIPFASSTFITMDNGFDANSTSTASALRLDTTGNVSASESVGGVFTVNRGTALGPAAVLYNNSGTGGGRLASLVCDNTAYDTQCFHVRSDSDLESTVNVLGAPSGKGIVKIGSNAVGDANSSGLSIDTSLSSFIGQGIFLKGNATGNLLNFRTSTDEEVVTITPTGFLGLGTSTPGTRLGVNGAGVFTGDVTAPRYVATSTASANRSVFTNASTTALSADVFCLASDGCRTTWPASGGGSWPFTQDSYAGVAAQSTSSPIWLKATSPFSLIATSTFVTQASSTQLTNSGSTWLPTLTSAIIQAGSDGLLAEYAGTSCTNQFVRSLSALGIATCASVTLTSGTDVTGVLPLANGGTNASALNSTQLLYNDGTRISGTSTPTASYFVATSTAHRNVFPYASTTALTVSGNSYLGTVSSGTWNGSTVAIAFGGTNATAYSSSNPLAFDGTRFSATSTPTASYFIATSTSIASVFPYASTTALTISGSGVALNVSSASATSTFAGGLTSNMVGVGTSTPSALLQLFSTASTTLSVDSNSSSRGGCIQIKDLDGSGYTYVYANNGVIYSSTISCK